jgi:hypothetical protein
LTPLIQNFAVKKKSVTSLGADNGFYFWFRRFGQAIINPFARSGIMIPLTRTRIRLIRLLMVIILRMLIR